MQLAVSLTSYKNTIHIFKVTYSSFCIFYFCFRKAANSECITSQEMSVFPNTLMLLLFWWYSVRQKYCCVVSLHSENTENWLKPRPSPSLPLTHLPGCGWDRPAAASGAQGGSRPSMPWASQQLGAIPVSPPRWGLAFGFEGMVMSSSWPENLSLVGKEKVDSSRPPGQEMIHFGYLGFQKDFFFPSVSPPYTRAVISLEIPAYDVGEIAKTGQKKGIKPIVSMYRMYQFPTVKCFKKCCVFIDLHFPLNTPHHEMTSTQQRPSSRRLQRNSGLVHSKLATP